MDLVPFFERLGQASQSLLMLDYDGTLAPFRAVRDQARPYSGVPALLAALRDLPDTDVVIISGRAIADVLPLLGLDPAPEIWGSHGWERRGRDGSYAIQPLSPRAREGIADLSTAMEQTGFADHCEQKPAGVALHWRGLDEERAQQIRALARRTWDALGPRNELEIKEFDGGLEVRAVGWDKGGAVRQLLAECDPDAICAYLGDDLTDEDAFGAIARRGLGLLVRPERRPTAASGWLKPPEELIAFLEEWHRRTGGGDANARGA